jgi:hypothetical protein
VQGRKRIQPKSIRAQVREDAPRSVAYLERFGFVVDPAADSDDGYVTLVRRRA